MILRYLYGLNCLDRSVRCRLFDGVSVLFRYRLWKYYKCFIGSEAVDWHVKYSSLSREEVCCAVPYLAKEMGNFTSFSSRLRLGG